MWRVVALSGYMNRLFTDFTELQENCTYTSAKQATRQGRGWGMILCASCSLRSLFLWCALNKRQPSV